MPSRAIQEQTRPILLFDDECGVCRRIASWVQRSARLESGECRIVVRPIGGDPDALRSLNRDLGIWEAYATIHLLMPDGSMKLGGEAIAEVLRRLPTTQWFAWSFAIGIFGFRPLQMLLNLAYVILADVRPLFGCESCGTPSPWVKPIGWLLKWGKGGPSPTPHFTSLSTGHQP
jgi:predicted DCC family thiol-disulfide oxidoreductase YuxK